MESKTIIENNGNTTKVTEDNVCVGEIELTVTRKDGTVEKHTQDMESFTLRFWEVFASAMTYQFSPNPDITFRNIISGSTAITNQEFTSTYECLGGREHGIVIGSGSAAVSLDDYTLDGEIVETICERTAQSANYVEGNYVTFSRSFTNISGGNVDVNELGLRGNRNSSNATSQIAQLTRDTISTITLADGDILGVSIKIEWPNMNRNFGAMLSGLYWENGLGSNVIRQTDGGQSFISASAWYIYLQLGYPSQSICGLVLGRGTGTTNNSINLANKIAEGTGTNQLIFGPMLFGRPYIEGDKCIMKMTRSVTNLSGADVTVSEIGWIGNDNSTSLYMMYSQDLSTPVTISDGVTYVFELQFTTSL